MVTLKKHIISKKPDYKKVFQHPPLLVSKDFSLWIKANTGLESTRFGVIVAKKHVKMAIVRNYSKRIAKELFKCYKDLFKNKDIVLVIKNNPIGVNLNAWKQKLASIYLWLNHFGRHF